MLDLKLKTIFYINNTSTYIKNYSIQSHCVAKKVKTYDKMEKKYSNRKKSSLQFNVNLTSLAHWL